MRKTLGVVVTTINLPTVLESYAQNFERYGHKEDVFMIVIPDLKTPQEGAEVVARIAQRGFDADYVEIPRQQAWMERFPDMNALIPYNTDNRRNIGFLCLIDPRQSNRESTNIL